MSDPAGLPAALAPIAEVLALADGFALCVVTGPRDHRDSVYLRLASSLADDLELVRHRLDRDGLELFDVLTGGDGVRPRVVFMSGLELLSDETRRDVTVRLNLLRDSWAPHPARVILWLTAWGLGEFRKLAPDLFHWRSCLVALHDADLPIRTEIEYLVWACERYGGAREAAHRSLMDADWFRWLTDHPRAVHWGYEGRERSHLLRASMWYVAVTRLRGLVSGLDLDVLANDDAAGWPDVPPLLPLFLQAADMAGRLPQEPGWLAVTRAAGIPIADAGADFLADLSERSQLLVLVDGIERLDLTPGSPAQRHLTWLDAENPGTRIALFSADDPLPMFATWKHVARPMIHLIAEQMLYYGLRPAPAVVFLLHQLFTAARDIHQLADYLFGPEIARHVPTDGPVSDSALALAMLLADRGLLDTSFFDQLKELRPAHAAAIDAVARAYFDATPR